jgi:cytoskeletal protein RodZ
MSLRAEGGSDHEFHANCDLLGRSAVAGEERRSVSSLPRVALGSSLAAARLALGLELQDVERETRIRARYLAALEDEDFDALPGEVYGVGFLRTYAGHLGLDGDAYAEELRRRRGAPAPDVGPVITRVARRRLGLLRVLLG